MPKRFRLTPELRSQIVAAIRSGGYPHVAAEAFCVPKEVFDDWLKRGNDAGARDPHAAFAREVRQAAAQARLRAEMTLFEGDPKLWLIHGPGRETDECPGWSVSVKPADPSKELRNAWTDPEILAILHLILEVLQPFPEPRSLVAQAALEQGMKQHEAA